MRHQVHRRKLGRTTSHRLAMFRNMATSLIQKERLETTLLKAKELRSFADHLITLAKKGDLPARRQALSFVKSKDAVSKLFSELALRFKDRNGGYTRILKTDYRLGDSAPMAFIEYLGYGEKGADKKAPAKKKPAAKVKKETVKKEAAPKKAKKTAKTSEGKKE